MAKKKSSAELKEEGVSLGEQITLARKRAVNFALQIGKDGLVLETDVKKNCDVLWRNAKKNGGGPKGAMGTMNVSGKVIELHCADDSAPNQLPKLAKKWLSERGQAYKVVMFTPSGTVGDEDEEDEEALADEGANASAESPEEEDPLQADIATGEGEALDDAPAQLYPDDPERASLMQSFQELSERLQTAARSAHEGAAKKTEKLTETFLSQVEQNPGKAGGVLKMLTKAMEDAIAFGTAESAEDPNAPGSPEAEATTRMREERHAKIEDLRSRVEKLLAELA